MFLPFAQGARCVIIVTGLIMLFVSTKWLGITKYYIYITSLLHVVYSFIPFDRANGHARIETGLQSSLEFTMCYFKWFPSLLISVFNMVWNQVGRVVVFQEPLDSKSSINLAIDMFIVTGYCWSFHMVLSLFGKYYVDAEILRKGNDELLDSLEEGLLIQDESSKQVIFINESAKNVARIESQGNEIG